MTLSRDGNSMNRTLYYSEEVSHTALALLALVAAGKSFDKAAVQSLRSLLLSHDDSRENRVNLTIFSGSDDEDDIAEPPVIVPFVSQVNNANRYHNGYGTLSFRNGFSSTNSASTRRDNQSHLRIFSPDAVEYPDEEEDCCVTTTAPKLRLYAE